MGSENETLRLPDRSLRVGQSYTKYGRVKDTVGNYKGAYGKAPRYHKNSVKLREPYKSFKLFLGRYGAIGRIYTFGQADNKDKKTSLASRGIRKEEWQSLGHFLTTSARLFLGRSSPSVLKELCEYMAANWGLVRRYIMKSGEYSAHVNVLPGEKPKDLGADVPDFSEIKVEDATDQVVDDEPDAMSDFETLSESSDSRSTLNQEAKEFVPRPTAFNPRGPNQGPRPRQSSHSTAPPRFNQFQRAPGAFCPQFMSPTENPPGPEQLFGQQPPYNQGFRVPYNQQMLYNGAQSRLDQAYYRTS
jgi:hypothetical protein